MSLSALIYSSQKLRCVTTSITSYWSLEQVIARFSNVFHDTTPNIRFGCIIPTSNFPSPVVSRDRLEKETIDCKVEGELREPCKGLGVVDSCRTLPYLTVSSRSLTPYPLRYYILIQSRSNPWMTQYLSRSSFPCFSVNLFHIMATVRSVYYY